MSSVEGQRLGRYEVSRALASGNMADLLLAKSRGLEGFERHVVIKRIRSETEDDAAFREMFIVEARLAAALHHSNIVQVHDVGEEDGKPYFVMEYLHGEDLRRILETVVKAGQTVPFNIVVAIAVAVGRALHHAHEQLGTDQKPLKIVHRDVAPANIVVGYDGNVKVLDFGIARAATRRAKTQAAMLRGKAPYMAPEQCTGTAVDRRSDVFGLGIVMYELLTARRLFKAENDFSTMRLITRGTFPPPSEIRTDMPSALEAIVMKALARSPSIRFQTAKDLFDALEVIAVDQKWQTSAGAVAAYMTELLGTRPEPWVATEPPAPVAPVDFDGDLKGLAKGPPESGPITIPSITAKSTSVVAPKPAPVVAPKPAPVVAPKPPVAAKDEANPFAEEDKPSSILLDTPARGVKVTGPPQVEVSGEVTQNIDVTELIEEPVRRVEVRTDVVKALPPPRPVVPPKPVAPPPEPPVVPAAAATAESQPISKPALGDDETSFVVVGRRPKWVVPTIIGGAVLLAIIIGAIAMSGDDEALLAATPPASHDAPLPLLALDAAEVAVIAPDAAEPDADLGDAELAAVVDADLLDATEAVALTVDAAEVVDAPEEVAVVVDAAQDVAVADEPVKKPTQKPVKKPVKKPTTKPGTKPGTKPNWNPNKLFPTKK